MTDKPTDIELAVAKDLEFVSFGKLDKGMRAARNAIAAHTAALEAAGMAIAPDWIPLEEIDDEPDGRVFHALLWGRLHIDGGDKKWWTEFKVLKAAWVQYVGHSNGSAKYAHTWYHSSEPPCRVINIEATHYMPLPEAPSKETP